MNEAIITNEELTTGIAAVRSTLRKIKGAGRLTGSFQRAQRHTKDAAMFAKRGALEAALEKLWLAREAANGAVALAAWA